MKLNRKSVTLGLAGLGIVGTLAAGVGVAAATTGSPGAPSPTTTSAGPHTGMGGMGSGMHGTAMGENSVFSAAANYLGLSQSDLQTQLQAGKSLANVVEAQGKSVSGLKDAMVAAMRKNLDANPTLTPDQKTAILTQAQSHIDTMVNATHQSGSDVGPMGGRMSGDMDEMMDGLDR